MTFMSLVLLLFLVLLSTKELWNHFKYHCNWAVWIPPHLTLSPRGVSGRASIACVPIASAKVRRIIALRKKTIWKSMKNYSFILFFGVWRLQNFRNRHEKRPIYPQNKVGRIPHTVSTRVWPSSKLHTSYNIYIARPYAYAHIDMNSSTSYLTLFSYTYSKREDAEQGKSCKKTIRTPTFSLCILHGTMPYGTPI